MGSHLREKASVCCCFTFLLASISLRVQGVSIAKSPDYGSDFENQVLKDVRKHLSERDEGDSSVGSAEREGDATETSSCDEVRSVPSKLRSSNAMKPNGLSRFYEKYTEAYGIPVLGSVSVPDAAIRRACYVLRFLLADRPDLRQAYYKSFGRVAVIGRSEQIADIPEYGALESIPPGSTVKGLAATADAPVSTGSAENLLCYSDERRDMDDVLLKSLAIGILNLAVVKVSPDARGDLERVYRHAVNSGWWSNTNAARNAESYFGEGVQSFFDANAYAYPPDGHHNDINTRTKLRTYDTSLYVFIQNVFTCANSYIKRCNSRGNEDHQRLNTDCHQSGWMF